MKYDLLTVPEKEQPLLFQPKSNTPAHQTKVGCVRGDFGKSGDEFHHTWFPHKEELNTYEFRTELTRVINSLRSEFSHPLLKSRDEMLKYCKEHPENELRGHWIEGTYVFKLEVPKYTFYLRCLPVFGDYKYWNASAGKEIKSVLLCDDGMFVASALGADTLIKRFNEMKKGG